MASSRTRTTPAITPPPNRDSSPPGWLTPRRVGSARLRGWYVLPGARQSLPSLRRQFLPLARQLNAPDLDAAAIRLAEPRELTQQIARWIYQQTDPDGRPVAGVQSASRHGDDLTLWALFERAGDTSRSRWLDGTTVEPPTVEPLTAEDPELVQALQTHRLTWGS